MNKLRVCVAQNNALTFKESSAVLFLGRRTDTTHECEVKVGGWIQISIIPKLVLC